MSEKITRAQAHESLSVVHILAVSRFGCCSVKPCKLHAAMARIRAYLAQQPSDDVVRKAHEAWRNIDRRFHERDAECMEEPCVLHGWLDELLAALPTMPEEK